jgi:hypothetical protein
LARCAVHDASRTFRALDVQGPRLRQGCAWIIETSDSKALAGAIRFNSFEKKWRSGQIGYELHPDYWGKGLMTEAVRAVVACGHETFGLNRIDAWTLPVMPRPTACWKSQAFGMKARCGKKPGSRARSTIFECSAGSRETPQAGHENGS